MFIQETPKEKIHTVFNKQKQFFSTHQSKNINFRLDQLKKFKQAIIRNRKNLEEALWKDLRKSPQEAYISEISLLISDIDFHIKNLKKWTRPKRIRSTLNIWPATSQIQYEPLGVSLIIAPWNYPVLLLLQPLIGSISAGGCAVLKPSPDTPNTARAVEKLIANTFPPEYITVIQGGKETNLRLLEKPFDLIFFTGSTNVGKIIMEHAAKHLTPVILELGGKSPVIVDWNADLDIAAKRIVWGKFLNAGQTCIAPDYLLVQHDIKKELIKKIIAYIQKMYGKNPRENPLYPRIVNEKAMKRLVKYLQNGKIITGGQYEIKEKYFAPTIIDQVDWNDPIMQEEIFGPVLPVLCFENLNQAIKIINEREKPLALYYFGPKNKAKMIMEKTFSGAVTINDTLIHVANHRLPFGGVGYSGMGKYHGKYSFLAFSHEKSIVQNRTWIDIPFRYPPFKWFKFTEKII